MSGVIRRVREQPAVALLALALVLAAAIYAPTLGYGVVNYDDAWLLENNFVVRDPSLASLRAIFFDLDPQSGARYALGIEYLPVRDLSIMLDGIVWGDAYEGYHLTNVLLYLLGIAAVFAWLVAFGVARTTAAIAVLLWAVHPSHAESVSWLSERKGLLGVLFAALAGLAYARFRAGRAAGWLVAAALAAVAAVWSKAPAAFLVASLAALELVLPARRVSWRRSLTGLAVIAIVGALAFVPVLMTAHAAGVVGDASAIPGGRVEAVLGALGFYVQLGGMVIPNAISYPISAHGPSTLQIALGALAALALVAGLVPRIGRHVVPAELRAATAVFALAWLPVSHLVLPVQVVAVADRYALQLTIGLALALAVALVRIPRRPLAIALGGVVVALGIVRSLDARASWSSSTALWARAVESNPADGGAWSMYAFALQREGEHELALAAVERGLEVARTPRLLLRRALMLANAPRPIAVAAMREAAEAGEPKAASNLALMLAADGKPRDGLAWARRGVAGTPLHANAHRTHGKVALQAGELTEAHAAFRRAYELEPQYAGNRYNLALALAQLGRPGEARPLLATCVDDRETAALCRRLLASLPPS